MSTRIRAADDVDTINARIIELRQQRDRELAKPPEPETVALINLLSTDLMAVQVPLPIIVCDEVSGLAQFIGLAGQMFPEAPSLLTLPPDEWVRRHPMLSAPVNLAGGLGLVQSWAVNQFVSQD